MSHLNNTDYTQILEFYKKQIPKSKKILKLEAEKILASKLCRCIKKISKKEKNESRAIGICTKTVINAKGLTRDRFKCKGKATIKLLKNNNKTRRNKK
jgi:hypothetical protein